MGAMKVDPEKSEKSDQESVSGIIGRLLQHIVALLEARMDLTRQEIRGALRDVGISLLLLVAALSLLLLMIPIAVAVLILVLAQILAPWLATAIVLVIMVAVCARLVLVARIRRKRRRLNFLTSLRQDGKAIRQALERPRRRPWVRPTTTG